MTDVQIKIQMCTKENYEEKKAINISIIFLPSQNIARIW